MLTQEPLHILLMIRVCSYVRNSEKVNISHIGNSLLDTKQGHLILKNILVVPNFKKALLSVAIDFG